MDFNAPWGIGVCCPWCAFFRRECPDARRHFPSFESRFAGCCYVIYGILTVGHGLHGCALSIHASCDDSSPPGIQLIE
ncbi:hypothetical protein PI125_g6304 [Phytophthora idaei]|nr:hypothetical protein PI125_g6304 [Phytophthora idaei]